MGVDSENFVVDVLPVFVVEDAGFVVVVFDGVVVDGEDVVVDGWVMVGRRDDDDDVE